MKTKQMCLIWKLNNHIIYAENNDKIEKKNLSNFVNLQIALLRLLIKNM